MHVIEVRAWGQRVGAVAMDSVAGCYAFQYADTWIQHGVELAPLTMPRRHEPYIFPQLSKDTYRGLPPLLADALPDDFGNALINASLAQQGISPAQITALDRLAYMGDRSMGCLVFKPARGPQGSRAQSTAIQLASLVLGVRAALSGCFDGDRETEAAIMNLLQVGTSAGGARAKAIIAYNPMTKEIRSGHATLAEGFEHWLLKLDGVGKDKELGQGRDYGKIEYAYSMMAKAAGIQMSDCFLLKENGRNHFMTKRFDRADHGIRHHISSLCSMAELDYRQKATHDYSQYFMAINRLGLGPDEREEAFRRVVFNIFAQNNDDHTKNLSFLLRQGSKAWELAPAYDLIYAYNPKGEWTYQHLMSVNGKFSSITQSDLLTLADRFLVPQAKDIIRGVADAVSAWPDFGKKAGVAESRVKKIQLGLEMRILK